MRSHIGAAAATVLLSGLLAALSPNAAAEAGAKGDEKLPDIGRGLYQIPDEPLPFIATDGTSATTRVTSATRARKDKGPGNSTDLRVAEFAGTLQREFPSSWTTFGRAPSGAAYDYDFVFTAEPPPSVVAQVQRLPIKARVWWGAPLSAATLQTAQLAVLNEAQDLFPGHRPAIELGLSRLNTTLGVFIGGDVPSPPSMSAMEVSSALDSVVDSVVGVNALSVIAEYDSSVEPAYERQVLSGGRNITSCTSGFGAYRPSTGRYGIITAAHCPEPTSYTGSGSPLPLNGSINGAAGQDIKFHSVDSPHTANAKFRVNGAGTEFTVSSVANPGQAASIGMYGAYGGRSTTTGGSTTGTISQVNVCYSGTDPLTGVVHNYCGGFRTNLITVGGDSGGPCFDGGAARGVISVGNSSYTWCANIQGAPSSVTVLQGS